MKLELLEELLDVGMVVMKPDIDAFRKAFKDISYEFEGKWGKGFNDKAKNER